MTFSLFTREWWVYISQKDIQEIVHIANLSWGVNKLKVYWSSNFNRNVATVITMH